MTMKRTGASVLMIALVACSSDDTGTPPDAASATDAGTDFGVDSLVPPDASVVPACPIGVADPSPVADAPVVYWVSQPVKPNETVVVAAGNVSAKSTIEIALVPDCPRATAIEKANIALDWHAVKPHYVSSTGTQFVIPASWPLGVYAFRITEAGKVSARAFINKPDVWSVQGDVGSTATPGGFFEAHGTSLGGTAELVKAGVMVKALTVDPAEGGGTENNGYRQRYVVPSDTPEGTYEIHVHNGRGGPLGWSRFSTFIEAPVSTVTVKARDAWPTKIFSVATQAGADDDARFAAAITAIEANGGGVLFVPAGNYTLNKPLTFTPKTIVRGEGRDKSIITWTSDPPDALMLGKILGYTPFTRASYSVEDVALVASATYEHDGIQRAYAMLPGWIRRVRVTLPRLGDFLDNTHAIFVETSADTEVTDSELDARNGFIVRDGVSHLRVERCVVHWRDQTLQFGARTHDVIVANNTFDLKGTAAENRWRNNPNPGLAYTSFYGTRIGGPYTRDFYYSRNKETRDTPEAETGYILTEGYTSDGAVGIYLGKFTMTAPTKMTIPIDTVDPGIDASNGKQITYDWTGAVAMIIDGKGIGQYRYLTKASEKSRLIEIDRPWDVQPDATSTINLVNLQGRYLWVNNDFTLRYTDQEYYSNLDIIRANNRYPVGAPEAKSGKPYTWSTFVSPWHFQVLDNALTSTKSMVTQVVDTDPSYGGVSAMNHVYRNNTYPAGSKTLVGFRTNTQPFTDSLIENNTMGYVFLGQPSDPLTFEGIVVRHNTAATDYGNLSGKDLTKLPGITYVP